MQRLSGLNQLRPPESTLVGRLLSQLDRDPSRTIVRFLGEAEGEETCLDYARVDRLARGVGAQLQEAGACGERALILHPPGIDYIIALLGCLYAGTVAVPAYPPNRRVAGRLARIAADARARFALAGAGAIDAIARQPPGGSGDTASAAVLARLQWLATDHAHELSDGQWQAPVADAGAVALLQYTSGSTSAPKGVRLTHANFLDNIDALSRVRGDRPDDCLVSWLPPFHDMGLVFGILAPLCAGVETTLMSPATFLQRPMRWLSAISRHGGTISGGPNFAYELCLRRITAPEQLATLDLSRWRMAFCGAERVRAATIERFAQAFAPAGLRAAALTPCYGLAESTVGVCFSDPERPAQVLALDGRALGEGRAEAARPGHAAQRLVGCGAPLAGCELRIVDPDACTPLPEDRVGEIWVRGASVGDGYWEKPELNREVFQARLASPDDAGTPRYLRTGDLGFVRAGELFVVGRIKDLIILRGINYYPEDIEATAQASFPLLRGGATAAFSIDEGGEERLVIVQALASAREAPLEQIGAAIRGAVAQAHEIAVERVVLVPPGAVPKTSSGKVQRRLCREQLQQGRLTVLGVPQAPGPRTGSAAAAHDPAREPAPPPARGGPDAAPAATVAQVAALMAELLGVPHVDAQEDFFWLGGHSLVATQLVSRIRANFAIDLPLRAVFEAPTPERLAARILAAPALERLPPVEPVDRSRALSLSYSQERMWLMHKLDPHGAAYNVGGALEIDGPLDVAAVGRAFEAVLARHEVLRTNYPTEDGEARAHIRPELHLPLECIDVSAAPDPAAAARARASTLLQAPFDVATEPLLRAELYRIAPERHLLCVCMHHLVTDAWSLGILVGDMLHCYDAFAAGRLPEPLRAGVSYLDYAHWQRRHLGGAQLAGQLAYWKERLAGAEPVALPVDRPRSQRRTSAGALLPLPLPDGLLDALTALGARQGATLFMVMLAAFDALLMRHTGAGDLVVGVPVANRNHLASESLMGSLVNTLALRVHVDPERDFAQLLAQVREVALDAFAHQDLPFERLVAELPVERRPGESPIVSVMFDFQNAPVPGRAHGPLRMRPVVLPRGASQFDLSLFVFQAELGRLASIEYSTDLFDPQTIARLLEHYVAILEAVVRDPTVPLARIPLLGADERAELLAIGTAPAGGAAAPPGVPAAFAACVQRSPAEPALVDDGGSWTYAQLDAAAAGVAGALRGAGVQPGDRVALFLDRDRHLPAAMLAVLQLGAAYVPLDPRYPAERLGYTLADARPRAVLSHSRLRAALAQAQAQAEVQSPGAAAAAAPCLCIDELAAAGAAASEPSAAARPLADDPRRAAYVIYTSGSTGRPKGVEVSSGALANFLRSMRHTPGIRPSDRLLAVTTVAFDIAGLEIWLPLTSGACVRVVPAETAADGLALLTLMRRWRPTVMQATPATWKMLIELGWEGDASLKVLCGGEAFAPELAQALLARSYSVWNLYGPTETTIWSTVHRVRDGEGPLVPIGTPIDGTRVYILDRHGALQPRGVAGEITIGGAGVAQGYFGRPDLTAERFVPDPFSPEPGARMYRTGDGGRIRSDLRFECLARLDDQIKLRGYRIEPGEIEAVIKDHPGVRDAIVVGRAQRSGDQRLVAYYVAAPGAAAVDALKERLQRRLPSYMVPSAFVALDAFPTTPNGKIDRARLPEPPAEAPAAAHALVAPRDALEAELVALWEELLETRPIGVRHAFFELGGHSLLAVRMFAAIEKRLGVALPLSTLLERPTIEYVAEKVRAARGADGARSAAAPVAAAPAPGVPVPSAYLVPVQPLGTRPTLYCVHGAGGNVLNFFDLARRLGPDQPFFGFQARGVDGRSEPFEDIEDMAQAYVRELRARQPRGPYFLSGYCGGGVIAFEMACRLRAQGQVVAFLGLLDSYRPGVGTGVKRHERWAKGVVSEGAPYLVRKTVIWCRRNAYELSHALRVAWYRRRGRTVPYELRDFWLTKAFLVSTRRYRPGIFDGRLTILRATQVDPELLGVGPELGWRAYATQGIQAFDVPGDHYSLLQEPYIGVLAATLKQCLDEAEGSAAT